MWQWKIELKHTLILRKILPVRTGEQATYTNPIAVGKNGGWRAIWLWHMFYVEFALINI